jgi:hypothetical protein
MPPIVLTHRFAAIALDESLHDPKGGVGGEHTAFFCFPSAQPPDFSMDQTELLELLALACAREQREQPKPA